MKKLFFIGLIFMYSCTMYTPDSNQSKAEVLVSHYLDSLNNHHAYKLIGFDNFHAIYTMVEDEPEYDRYKNTPSKLDSIEKHFKSHVRAYVIYVEYDGKDDYGNIGKHKYQCAIDEKLTKCIVGIEIDNIIRK